MAGSLPSRGAWIEIGQGNANTALGIVAPLAGSVDRNFGLLLGCFGFFGSLPSRGAWIEIGSNCAAAKRPRSLPSRGAWIEMAHNAVLYA